MPADEAEYCPRPTSLSLAESVGKSMWIWEACKVNSDPANVAEFFITQTTSSPFTSKTYQIHQISAKGTYLHTDSLVRNQAKLTGISQNSTLELKPDWQHWEIEFHEIFSSLIKSNSNEGRTKSVSVKPFLLTSSHTDVVSLPVNKYWPMKMVSPFFTAWNNRLMITYIATRYRRAACDNLRVHIFRHAKIWMTPQCLKICLHGIHFLQNAEYIMNMSKSISNTDNNVNNLLRHLRLKMKNSYMV